MLDPEVRKTLLEAYDAAFQQGWEAGYDQAMKDYGITEEEAVKKL